MKKFREAFIKKYSNNNKGFTLIEMITAMAIMALFTGALYSLFLSGGKIYQVSQDSYKSQNEARIAMSYITVKIRQNDAVTSSGSITSRVQVEQDPSGDVLKVKMPSGPDWWSIYLQGGKLIETTGVAFSASEPVIAEGLNDLEFTTSSAINGSDSIGIRIKYNDYSKELNETVTLRADP